jgi:hypothetical protein
MNVHDLMKSVLLPAIVGIPFANYLDIKGIRVISIGIYDITLYVDGKVLPIIIERLGPGKKEYEGDYFLFTSDSGIRVYTQRDGVCTRRVVGTKTVMVKKPIAFEEVEETQEIVEWDCGSILDKTAK